MEHPYILENGEQKDITPQQADALVEAGLIYDSGDGYYHICEGKTRKEVEAALKAQTDVAVVAAINAMRLD